MSRKLGQDSWAQADLVVVGAGIAGLTAALDAAADGLRVLILCKGTLWNSGSPGAEQSTSTYYAQGGIAVVAPDAEDDSIDLHVFDTLAAGGGLVDPDATREIVAGGWPAVAELVGRGADFDRSDAGRFRRTREGGHSVRRIIHAGGDATGAQIQRALVRAVVESSGECLRYQDRVTVTDLVCAGGAVTGVAYVDAAGSPGVVSAPTVLLATGGSGHLYSATTNPAGATGDGIALAVRAGAVVADLEFIQFHPTMLYLPGARGRRMLVSEAVRGEGGRLVDACGNSVTRSVPGGDLAPRDVVACAVQRSMATTGQTCVYLDVGDVAGFERRFPTITAGLHAAGLGAALHGGLPGIPVVPGAHYQCGGIVAAADGTTSVPGLLAAGEVARTGLHGANRLASNSLLEGLVAGRGAARRARERCGEPTSRLPQSMPLGPRPALDRVRLQDLMSECVTLTRTEDSLLAAGELLREAPVRPMRTVADVEDAALTLAARAVVAAATARRESRGCHRRDDYPSTRADGASRAFSYVDDEFVSLGDVRGGALGNSAVYL